MTKEECSWPICDKGLGCERQCPAYPKTKRKRSSPANINITEQISRTEVGQSFAIFVSGKKEAHQKMRDAHGAATRKGVKISTHIMRAVDVNDYEYSATLVRIMILEKECNA